MVSIETYEEILKVHDWDYEYTEDSEVWARGNDAYHEIREYSNLSIEHKRLFNKYKDEVHRPKD